MTCLLALMVFATAWPAAAQKTKNGTKGGGIHNPPNIPVASTLNNSASYQIQSDGLYSGAYQDVSADSTDNVSSILQGGTKCCDYDWILDTRNSGTRGISITLIPDPSNAPNSPFNGPLTLHARIIVQCHLEVTNSFLAIQPGGHLTCPMATAFAYNGGTYKLGMGYSGEPTTNPVTVTCTQGNSSGVCNSWTVTPSYTDSQSGVTYNVAHLQVETKNGRWNDIGDYDVNFSFKVTNP